MVLSAHQAVDDWEKEGLLTAKKAEELRRHLEGRGHDIPHRAIGIFSAVGATLLGLGVILFVASNWDVMVPVVKIALLMLGMMLTAGFGYMLNYEQHTYEKTGLALLFVNILIYGASIFLVAQIYHLPLNFWWGMLLWFLGTAYFAYVLQSKLHLWLSVPLFILFLGWVRSQSVLGFSELDFFFQEDANIVMLLPLLGVALVSLGILHRRGKSLAFGEGIFFHWGLFLLLAPLVASTADKWAFYSFFLWHSDAVSIIVALSTFILAFFAMTLGEFRTLQGRWSILALLLSVTFVYLLASLPRWLGFPESAFSLSSVPMITGLFVLHVLLVFILLLTIVWYGTLLRLPGTINLGILGLGVAILIQYFSWAFQMLDRSLAFIIGGALILLLSALLERQRRFLVSSMYSR